MCTPPLKFILFPPKLMQLYTASLPHPKTEARCPRVNQGQDLVFGKAKSKRTLLIFQKNILDGIGYFIPVPFTVQK